MKCSHCGAEFLDGCGGLEICPGCRDRGHEGRPDGPNLTWSCGLCQRIEESQQMGIEGGVSR